jgi:hypothetical protein
MAQTFVVGNNGYMTTSKKITPEILIDRRQAAARIGVHIRSIDYYLRVRKLTKYRDGRNRVWIDPEELDALITPVAVVESADR